MIDFKSHSRTMPLTYFKAFARDNRGLSFTTGVRKLHDRFWPFVREGDYYSSTWTARRSVLNVFLDPGVFRRRFLGLDVKPKR